MTERKDRFFGIPENLFSHLEGRSNMITKMPVRLMSLAMMDLFGKSVMWDVGFCTGLGFHRGEVLQFPELDIVAFERRGRIPHAYGGKLPAVRHSWNRGSDS